MEFQQIQKPYLTSSPQHRHHHQRTGRHYHHQQLQDIQQLVEL
jgi:PHP family Zn ribbon phosphoesterase